jgi:hypothetical protein
MAFLEFQSLSSLPDSLQGLLRASKVLRGVWGAIEVRSGEASRLNSKQGKSGRNGRTRPLLLQILQFRA